MVWLTCDQKICVKCSKNSPMSSPCCCGVSCWRRGILADPGWRLLRLGQADWKKRWTLEPVAVTLSVAQPPAVWDQHLETWEVCPREGSHMKSVTQTHAGRWWQLKGMDCTQQGFGQVSASLTFRSHLTVKEDITKNMNKKLWAKNSTPLEGI